MNKEPSLIKAKECISASLTLISGNSNEQAIRDSFTSYLRLIFHDAPSWVLHHIRSANTGVALSRGTKQTTGFVDNLVNSTAIEYESDLRSTPKFTEGYGQVKDYCASLINDGRAPDLVLGVLSDTIRWFAYAVSVKDAQGSRSLTRDQIELHELEQIDLSAADDLAGRRLITFLGKYLGRVGARLLEADSIAIDLGFDSPFCAKHITDMEQLVRDAFAAKPDYAKLITSLWCKFVSYFREQGSTASFSSKYYADELYVSTLGKLICANVIEKTALLSDDRNLRNILDGQYFESKGLVNLVEYDYFGWLNEPPYIEKQLVTARAIQQDLQAYDFAQAPAADLFGSMMAQFAERSKRLLLGQEATPSWLSSQLVAQVMSMLPRGQMPQLVDMCCGSGTMIVECVKQTKLIIDKASPKAAREERLHLLTQSITGFDIDPLAVILSKINWVLAARDWLEPFGTLTVTIPVFHADSLFAITPLTDAVEEEPDEEFHLLKVADHDLKLPTFLLSSEFQALFDGILERGYSMALAAPATQAFQVSDSVIADAVDSVLTGTSTSLSAIHKHLVQSFTKDFTEKLHQLNREGKNGIWAFILRNSYRPGLVAGQFNGLVSNPPWLALSKIANNPYQEILKKKAEAFGIKPTGSSHLHIELATIFLLHAVDRYLRPQAAVGCITPETLLNGHHHNPFRMGAYASAAGIDLNVETIWRIENGTFKNNAIVIFGRKVPLGSSVPSTIPGASATKHGVNPLTFYRHTQGNRIAWSEKRISVDAEPSGFFDPANFRQGADVMPRTLFFFEVSPAAAANPGGQWSIKSIDPATSPLAFAVKDAKKNQGFKIAPAFVPGDLIFDVLTSNLLTPFDLAAPLKSLIPIRKDDARVWQFLSPVTIASKGAAVQNVFNQICAAINTKATLADLQKLINVRNKLTLQVIKPDEYIVLTGAGGGHVCSAFAAPTSFDFNRLVMDQTVYWTQVDSEDEAIYLSGLFNSEAINSVIKEFQPKGAFGERHVHKLPFGVTPPFDSTQAAHQDVVATTKHLIADYADLKARDGNLRRLLDPNSGSLARRRLGIQSKLKQLGSYANYERACEGVYGV